MKWTYFVAAVVLSISTQSQANRACQIMFQNDFKYSTTFSQIEKGVESARQHFLQALLFLYKKAGSLEMNQDINAVQEELVSVNNSILDVATLLRGKKFHFSSRKEKQRYEELMEMLRQLFYSQQMQPQAVEYMMNRRFEVADQIQIESQQNKSQPIGFLPQGEIRRSHKERLQPNTIGFLRRPIEPNLYGKKSNSIEEANQEVAQPPRSIGFLTNQNKNSEAEVKPLKTIGFIQSKEPVDVGYRLHFGFDFSTGYFVLGKENQNPMGFIR